MLPRRQRQRTPSKRRTVCEGKGLRADRGGGTSPARRIGLLLGDGLLLGMVNIDIVEDIIHLITGGLLAYVGFGQRDEGVARSVVLALGVMYLLVACSAS